MDSSTTTPTTFTPPADLATTLGELRSSGWLSRSVAEEIAINLETKIAAGEAISAGVQGFEETVLPQLETAILAGHDVILLGERGLSLIHI